MLIGHDRYALLTKGEVKMPEYWPNSFLWLFMDWDEVEVFKKHTKKNEADIQQSWLNKLGQWKINFIAKRFLFIKNQEWLV